VSVWFVCVCDTVCMHLCSMLDVYTSYMYVYNVLYKKHSSDFIYIELLFEGSVCDFIYIEPLFEDSMCVQIQLIYLSKNDIHTRRLLDWISDLSMEDPVCKRCKGRVPLAQTPRSLAGASQIHGLHLIPFNNIEQATDMFSSDNLVGSGGFGDVYTCTLYIGGVARACAVKRLKSNGSQGVTEFHREIDVMMVCRHENIVPLWACSMNGSERCLVYPFVSGGSLHEKLAASESCLWKARVQIAIHCLRATEYLHSLLEGKPLVVHRDIKPANILLDEDCTARLCDVGFSRLYDQPDQEVSTRIVGTRGYMSPEYARYGICSPSCDNFSLGVVFLQLLTGLPALNPDNAPFPPDLPTKARKATNPALLADVSAGVWPSEVVSVFFKIGVGLSCDDADERMEISDALSQLESLELGATPSPRGRQECVICLEGPRNTRFVSCGHKAVCQTCSTLPAIQKCPLCRVTITQRVLVDESEPSFIRCGSSRWLIYDE
jgi:serine/threonine protein kinase